MSTDYPPPITATTPEPVPINMTASAAGQIGLNKTQISLSTMSSMPTNTSRVDGRNPVNRTSDLDELDEDDESSAPPPPRKRLRIPKVPKVNTIEPEDPIELCSSEWVTTLSLQLQQLRERSLFCDVVIQTADSATYSAHANVLAASSPTLSTYMQDTGLFVKFDDINGDTWQLLLAFMYTGKVNIMVSCELESCSDFY